MTTSTNRNRCRGKSTALKLLLFLGFTANLQAADVKVFLLGGQSNMDGRADASTLPTSPVNLQAPQGDVLFYYDHAIGLTTLRTGSNRNGPTGTKFGPEITFGRTIADAFPIETYALIKYSLGATNLHTDWNPIDGPHYSAFKSTVANGITALQNAGHTTEIVGMLWHQGESDADDANSGNYQTNLNNFIADVRSNYGANLPFLIAEIRRWVDDSVVVADAQIAVAAADINSHFVPADDLSYLDVVHLDTNGQIDLGQRFAQAFASLLGDDVIAPTPDPLTFEIPPTTVTASSITMTASTASDISGVEYYFENTAGEGNDSGWQDSPTFVDSGLQANTKYSYRVRARDESSNQNPTAFSAAASADTSNLPVVITPVADTYIRANQATTNYGGSTIMVANNNFTRFSFIRFDISGLGTITDATFDLETTAFSPQNYAVLGLIESDDDWVEGELTWNNSTNRSGNAIDTADIYGGAELTNFDDSSSGSTNVFTVSSGDIIDFLNADTDGIVTFVISETGATDSGGSGWATREHATAQAPTLTLSAVEPSDYSDWISGFFPGETTPEIVDGDADPDRDSLTNDEEYAFGLDPNDAASASPISINPSPSHSFTYTRRNSRLHLTGLTYTYSYSNDLTGWTPFTPESVSSDDEDPVETITVEFSTPLFDQEETLFFQVEALPQG